MFVECYALVVFEVKQSRPAEGFTNFERAWNNLETSLYKKNKISREVEYHFCHLKLVQPQGKNGSVPVPKWEIVEDFIGYHYKRLDRIKPHVISRSKGGTIRYCGEILKQYSEHRFSVLLENACEYDNDVESELLVLTSQAIQIIDDRRLQLKQIRALFPECVKMPLAIALDYIRDRM